MIFFAHGFIAAVLVQGSSFKVLMTYFWTRTQLLNIFTRVMNVVAEDDYSFMTFPQVVCFPVGAVRCFGTPIVPSSQKVVFYFRAKFSIVAVGQTTYFYPLALE